MIITNLKGGLGNQMFQYAAARRLAEINDSSLKLDLSFINHFQFKPGITPRNYDLHIFNINEDFAKAPEVARFKNLRWKILRKFWPRYSQNPYINETDQRFQSELLGLSDNKYLDGHWMSEKYFKDIEFIIRQEFTFKRKILDEGQPLLNRITQSNSVCIQIRRGDYVANAQIAKIHQTTTLSYFYAAIEQIRLKILNPVFFVFSDDPNWCKLNLNQLENCHFVEMEFSNGGVGDYFQLMVHCKYFIISNSTFGWWGAWLSRFEQKIVIAPKCWFKDETIFAGDICPNSWIKI